MHHPWRPKEGNLGLLWAYMWVLGINTGLLEEQLTLLTGELCLYYLILAFLIWKCLTTFCIWDSILVNNSQKLFNGTNFKEVYSHTIKTFLYLTQNHI